MPGTQTTVCVVGNLTTDLKDRPAVKYDTEVTRDSAQHAEAAGAPGAGRIPVAQKLPPSID